MRRVLGSVTAVVAALVVMVTTGASAPAGAGDRSAPVPPRIPYLVGDSGTWTIHDGATTVTLPASIVDNTGQPAPTPGRFGLVGVSTQGYVVSEFADSADPDPAFRVQQLQLHVVHPDGSARTFYDRSGFGNVFGLFGRDDTSGRVLVGSSSAEEIHWRVTGVRLDGTSTRPASLGEQLRVLDAPSARRVLTVSFFAGGSTHWRVAVRDLVHGGTRLLPGISVAREAGTRVGSLGADLYGWRLPYRSGTPVTMAFARLSHPHHVLWRAPFDAFSFGPGDTRLLGWAKLPPSQTTAPRVPLQMRRASDGHVVATLHYGLAGVDSVAWEDRSHVLVSYGGTVVRCAASGACSQVLVSTGRVTFPSQ